MAKLSLKFFVDAAIKLVSLALNEIVPFNLRSPRNPGNGAASVCIRVAGPVCGAGALGERSFLV